MKDTLPDLARTNGKRAVDGVKNGLKSAGKRIVAGVTKKISATKSTTKKSVVGKSARKSKSTKSTAKTTK